MVKEGLLLGISLSFPGELSAGLQPWYKEFESIRDFISYTNKEFQKEDPKSFNKNIDDSIKTFQDAEDYWKEDGCVVVIITPEWCKKHQNYWAKYGDSPINVCPQCDEDREAAEMAEAFNYT